MSNLISNTKINKDYKDYNSQSSLVFGYIVDNYDWGSADYYPNFTEERREILNNKIIENFSYREISIIPLGKWVFHFVKLLNNILPKYENILDILDNDINMLSDYTFNKGRNIFSEYPQEKINNTNDYASSGTDNVYEEESYTDIVDKIEKLKKKYNDVYYDIICDLDKLFTHTQIINY